MKKYKFLKGTNKFDRSLEALTRHFKVDKKAICLELATLMINVDAAKVIPGFNKLRKLRVGIPGVTGKRNGLRFLFYADPEKMIIIPLELYHKGDKEDLTHSELAALIDDLKDLLASEETTESEIFRTENLQPE